MQHIDPKKWTATHAAHLANRAGFGLPPQQLQAWTKSHPRELIENLTQYSPQDDATPLPQFTKRTDVKETAYQKIKKASENHPLTQDEKRAIRKTLNKQHRKDLIELRAWWLYRMQDKEQPLREKLTLFWHGHFATSVKKVNLPYAIYLQNQTLRKHSNGNFRELVNAISKDPAMLQYLDNDKSRRKAPNENYARELMELFTLGEGHYSEQDIKESARAFTGYGINKTNRTFQFTERRHDPGIKTFMGQSGNFNGEDITRIILEQPQTARHICKKLWTFFAYENPADPIIDHLANTLRQNHYNLQPLLQELFTLEAFYHPTKSIRQQIKSPVQWYLHTLNTLQTRALPPKMAQRALKALGQTLFEPPNVKGWDGGAAWITAANLFNRYNLSGVMVKGMSKNKHKKAQKKEPMMGAMQQNILAEIRGNLKPLFDMDTVLPSAMRTSRAATQKHLFWLLFQSDLRERDQKAFADFMEKQPHPTEWKPHHLGEALHALMSTPQYQLT